MQSRLSRRSSGYGPWCVGALVIAGLATAFLTLYIPFVKGGQKSKDSRIVRRSA
jgi:hypothetical protein